MRDPYAVLGVAKDATPDAIKAAFRTLAKKFHPDLHPGDLAVERRFKEASGAYDLLSDPKKRRRFDAGEIDAEGKERARQPNFEEAFRRAQPRRPQGMGDFEAEFARPGAAGGGGKRFGADDLFSELFETFGGGRKAKGPARGEDLRVTLGVSFLEAAKGASKRIRLPTGRQVDVRVPSATATGQALRLAGLGRESADGGAPGDVIVEIVVAPDEIFRREDRDIWIDLPITLKEALLGARISVPTIDGPVMLTVPKETDAGAVLRLKGRGLAEAGNARTRGDQYVKLIVRMPGRVTDALRAAAAELPDDGEALRRRAGIA